MQVLSVRYAQYFNRRYGRTGTLFEGRYRSTVIDTDVYWLGCLRDSEANPVRAGVVSLDTYPCSSYASNHFGVPDRLLTRIPSPQALGPSDAERQDQWRTFCAAPSEEDLDLLRNAFHAGGVLGRVIIPAESAAETPGSDPVISRSGV